MLEYFTSFSKDFFCRPTLEVAPKLLGAYLVRRLSDGRILSGPIVELEAYTQDDPACHAFRGPTERSRVMFGPPGHAYVYFIYGMYYCLNVVTEPVGTPGAILIRAVGSKGTNGPGRLCREWQIGREHNGISLVTPGQELWLCPGKPVAEQEIVTSHRIGISAGRDLQWRFYLRDHPCLSRPQTGSSAKR